MTYTLRVRWARPGLELTGLDEDGRIQLYEGLTIGRSRLCDLHVPAIIGGRTSYSLAQAPEGWRLRHGGHIGRFRHNDGPPLNDDALLRPGDTFTLLDCADPEAPVVTIELERGLDP